MKNKLFLLTTVLSAVLFSCKQSDPVTKIPLDPAFKTAFDFMPGSYWIYKDSATSEIDSFFVLSNLDFYTDPQRNNNGVLEQGEFIEITIREHNISSVSVNNDTVLWSYSLAGSIINEYYSVSKLINYTGAIEYSPLVFYPFQLMATTPYLSTSVYAGGDTCSFIGVFNSYVANGLTFFNVAEVNHKASLLANSLTPYYSYNDWLFVCPNIGLIKMRLNHPQDSLYRVWELQRWLIK